MSRPYQMQCSKCGKNITMAGSRICEVCTPIRKEFEIEDLEAAAEAQPLLCDKCFDIVHQHSVRIG